MYEALQEVSQDSQKNKTKMNRFKTEKRGAFYFDDKIPYVSVTNILKVIDKPAIRYWYGKQIYFAMLADPTLNEAEAMASPYKVSDKAKSRGSTVHSLIEALKGGAKIGEVPEEFAGYKKAFESWMEDIKPEIIENEKTVINKLDKYAGTLDMLAKVGGKLHVVDFKTSKTGETYMEAELQVSAYAKALGNIEGAIIVGLGENGKYTHKNVVEMDRLYKAFIACRDLWYFLNKEDSEKVGYKL